MPTSVLNDMNNSICCRRVIEAQVSGVICVVWTPGGFNLEDLLTGTTIPGNTFFLLIQYSQMQHPQLVVFIRHRFI